MNDKLRIYAYNVLFGDAILVDVPDGPKHRFILIDVGNVLGKKGGDDSTLLDAATDIRKLTGGKIDLYIMTHEHMDHVQGLLTAHRKGCDFDIDTVWMTVSSAPDYYESHEKARKKRRELELAVQALQRVLGTSGLPDEAQTILEINAITSTKDYVDFIRSAGHKVYYVYRGLDIQGRHPFTETTIRILAPEEDSSVYYGYVPRFDIADAGSPDSVVDAGRPLPLPGVDGGAFYGLMDRMDSACSEGMFGIDQANNNTSVVFELMWRGRRLLFTGDAEQKSWRFMKKYSELRPVDFFKVGHHGSKTAAPSLDILNTVLPARRRDVPVCVVSTCRGVYKDVPDDDAMDEIKAQGAEWHSTADERPGQPVVMEFEGRNK